ncbi:MAG TPA: beta-1,6-N-acetylglucosaminyltransferase [Stellaceae bacterium]|nr:beta-1,6-N-acetylglucosaminyltransferase [Stellaceae bacterium]
MKLAFAIVAHGNARVVERLVDILIAEGHQVALHYDLKSPPTGYQHLLRSFAGSPAVRFARRVKVGWGQWSIVEATLNCLEEIAAAGWEPDYVYYLSGMDYPIRSSADLLAFLERNKGKEFIESVPAEKVRWVRTGPQQERYQYRFPFNWREQRRRSEWFWKLQKGLGWKRRFVRGMTPHIGSQWWVLSWPTLKQVMALARERDIKRFFRTTLVPDELFFQTLVRQLVPAERIVSRTLTLYQFSDYGIPVVYYIDHLDYLLRQPFFMARKISQHQMALRDALDECWRGGRSTAPLGEVTVGAISRDYEDFRRTHRDGVPGLPVVGRAPRRRQGPLERLQSPYVAVLGSSAAELRFVHKALARRPELLCHGQLFHPRRIEFADGRATMAGYRAEAVKLRNFSPSSFLADIVRSEGERLTSFLLLWGQGGHIPELIFERANARIIILRGDPLVAFSEEILGRELLLDEPYDTTALAAVPPSVFAHRYRQFLNDFRKHTRRLANKARRAAGVKPRGWISELDVVGRLNSFPAEELLLPRPRPGSSAELARLRWHGRPTRLEAWLGEDLALGLTAIAAAGSPATAPALAGSGESELIRELREIEARRELMIERLVAGDIRHSELARRAAEARAVLAGN